MGKKGAVPVKGYFRKICSDYQKSVEKESIAGVHQRIQEQVNPQLHGVVLDLGSGGVTSFRSDRVTGLISMDNVLEFLKNSRNPDARSVCGDVLAIPLGSRSVDVVIMQHVIHHLTAPSYTQNARNVGQAISETSRILKSGGTVHLIDSFTPAAWERLQIWAYPVSYRALRLAGKPMVFFLSARYLSRLLELNNLAVDRIQKIDWGEMAEASQALFPWLKFPLKYTPMACLLISARLKA
jgi:ubiquinone/menaquinone biosynthesis C-methylase UbiE